MEGLWEIQEPKRENCQCWNIWQSSNRAICNQEEPAGFFPLPHLHHHRFTLFLTIAPVLIHFLTGSGPITGSLRPINPPALDRPLSISSTFPSAAR
jgi:hypothetical protein